MGWIEYRDKSRIVIICIGLLLALIVIIGALGVTGIKRLSDDSTLLYQEELIPAMDMAQILEKLYENRFHLEEHITGISNTSLLLLEEDIYRNNHKIDSIIQRYFDISVGDSEDRYLVKSFSDNIRSYRKVEHAILKASRRGDKKDAEDNFKYNSYDKFQKVVEPILSFSAQSLKEGKELYSDAISVSYRRRMALYVSISIAFVVVVVIGIVISRAYLD